MLSLVRRATSNCPSFCLNLSMAPHATTQSSNFIMMAEQGKFVDKSLALVEFLDADDEPIHLVLRPRRSGKTILLRLFR